jgi:hypothetical protein
MANLMFTEHRRAYLSEVELGILLCRNTFDLKEGSVRSGIAFGAFVAEDTAF